MIGRMSNITDIKSTSRALTVRAKTRPLRELAHAVDTDDDAADLDASGHDPAILAMAGLTTAPAAALVPPASATRTPRWGPSAPPKLSPARASRRPAT